MKGLKISAPGHDGISAAIVKEVACEIIEPLTFSLSLSMKIGKILIDLKTAKIIPLFKSGEQTLFSNYRLIVIPCFCKILGKLVYKRTYKY